jgi:hypothetical protein
VSFIIADGFAYAIDDPYIHLAVAKNLFYNSTWGAVWNEFSGTSSSILFTMLNWLLYVFLPAAISEYYPMILNVIAANLLVHLTFKLSDEFKFDKKLQLALFAILIVYLPLVANVMNGMEHLWHIFFLGFYIINLKRIIANENYSPIVFYLATIFMSASRYEGLFVVAAGFLVLAINKKYAVSVLQVFAAFLPLTIYGIYSMGQGGYFLPNTLLAKGKALEPNLSAIIVLVQRVGEILMTKKQILPSVVILLASGYYFARSKSKVSLYLTIFVGLVFLQHITFADFGWFFRYEAYLIFMSGVVLLIALKQLHTENKLNKLVVIAAIVISLPLVYRFVVSIERSNTSGKYFKEVHEDYALFVRDNFDNNEMIMAGDIGTLCFFTENPILDVNGLATGEVTEAIRNGYQTSNFMDSLAAAWDTDLAIMYRTWEGDLLSDKWKNIGYWYQYNPTAGDSTYFGLYTTNEAKIERLEQLFEKNKQEN